MSVCNSQLSISSLNVVHAISFVLCPSHSFVFSDISAVTIFKFLFSSPFHSFVSGSDGIPVCVLRIVWPIISSLIVRLFIYQSIFINLSLDSFTFPSE